MKIPTSTYIQVGVWTSLFVIPTLIFGSLEKPEGFYFFLGSRIFLLAVSFNLSFHIITPLYFLGRKRAFWGFSVLSVLTYILASVAVDFTLAPKFPMVMMPPNVGFAQAHLVQLAFVPAILSGLLIFGISAALAAFSAFEKKKNEEEIANHRRIEAELDQLKSQLNPHFLFNTLHGIYALALSKSDAAPEAVLKLSHLLRYVMAETNADFVPLERDLEHLRHFVALHQMRLTAKTPVKFTVEGDPTGHQIAPLLLLPFVENAFKFGTSTREVSPIDISLKIKANALEFICQNQVRSTDSDSTGIGIANTRRRLDLLYAGRHELKIEEREGLFRVMLKLGLMRVDES